MGYHNKALEYQLRALKIQLQLFGELIPNTAAFFNNVAHTYSDLENHEKALEYALRGFDINCQLPGELHPKTATTLGNIIYSLTKLKCFQEARDRLNDYQDQLPQDHPKYEDLSNLKKFINKEERKSMGSVPSKKKKKKKKK
ncbi:MAG: tetratricopeptide repeat protein [Candidatus Aminicenantes bacterium]